MKRFKARGIRPPEFDWVRVCIWLLCLITILGALAMIFQPGHAQPPPPRPTATPQQHLHCQSETERCDFLPVVLKAEGSSNPKGPETALPTVFLFESGKIVVYWAVIPAGFENARGWVILSGINGYEQEIDLVKAETHWYVGTIRPVPRAGLYWLSYGCFLLGNDAYSVAFLPNDPITIESNRLYLPITRGG